MRLKGNSGKASLIKRHPLSKQPGPAHHKDSTKRVPASNSLAFFTFFSNSSEIRFYSAIESHRSKKCWEFFTDFYSIKSALPEYLR
jgi:hypothetical protein